MAEENTQVQDEQVIDSNTSAETENTDTERVDKQAEQKIPYDRFKAKVDEANDLKRKLEGFQKEREEAERKRLEEEGKYKEIAESLQAKLDAIQGDALKAKKEALLVKAGYTEDQVAKYLKYVDGSNDDELTQAVEALKADIPPKPRYADPGVGNGAKQEPKKTDLQEKGKTMYQRLKEKGKIRR
jgi:hypothetical protein